MPDGGKVDNECFGNCMPRLCIANWCEVGMIEVVTGLT